MFCQVEPEQVVAVHDVESTYHVPLLLKNQGLILLLEKILRLDLVTITPFLLKKGTATWNAWKSLTLSQDQMFQSVSIVLVGKYTNLKDSYLSVIKSLEHAAMACRRKLNLIWVDASNLEEETSKTSPAEFHKAWHEVCTAQGILVPGGFGHRGTEGMIAAARWARENNTPYLGICLGKKQSTLSSCHDSHCIGMQIAVIEFARSVCKLPNAASIELDERTSDPVVVYMPEIDRTKLGATMRLGLRPTHFQIGSEWSKLRELYTATSSQRSLTNGTASGLLSPTLSESAATDAPIILERHRHRYEVNPAYVERLASHGLSFIGKDDKGERMEILELRDHPWFVGVQFHPEYLSRVLEPSKPYLGFVAASSGCLDEVIGKLKGSKLMGIVNGNRVDDDLVNGVEGFVI